MGKYEKPQGSFISFMSNKVKMHGGINLAQGIPGFQPPEALLDSLNRLAYEKVHQYAPGIGNLELLQLLEKKYMQYSNITQEDFLITNGGTEAVSLLYTYFNKILKKPYSALAFEPVYESYKMLPEIFNDAFIPFSLNKDGSVDFKKLEKRCKERKVKIIFLNTPGNPYGKIWEKDEMESLIELTAQRNIFLIIDAVYQELYFTSPPYHPLHFFKNHVFYVNSFSKLFSITGWRIGYLVAGKKHMNEIQSIHDYTGLCVPSVLQAALADFLENENWGEEYIQSLRERLTKNFFLLRKDLEELGFTIPDIEGGFFVWAQLPEGWKDGFQLTMDLYEKEKVAVIPGEHFSEKSTNYIRLNIARSEQEIEEALVRMKRFFA